MRADQAHPAVHLDMDLDEGGRPGDPGAQIMRGDHVGMRLRDRADLLALLVGQLVIHQLEQRQPRQLHRGIDDPDADRGAEQRVEQRQIEGARQDQRGDDAEIQDEIAAVMQLVGADRDRAGAPHDMALIERRARSSPRSRTP